MIVDGQYFLWLANVMQAFGLIDNQIDSGTRGFMGQIFFNQLGTAAGINQVVEAHPGDLHFFDEVEYVGDFINVVFVDRKAQPHLYAGILAIFNALHGRIKSAAHTSEAVIDFRHAVQADADIRKSDSFEGLRQFGADQCAVG